MASPPDAYAAATRTYLSGQRVDMRELARELDISRNTLYRWTGGRERLLQDVIWALSQLVIDDVWARTAALSGADRVVEALRLYVETVTGSAALQEFLRNETYAALRLLTSRGPFQDKLVAEVKRLADEEAARGTYVPRGDTGLLAYAVVRLIEGFVYNDAIVQRETAIDEALEVIRLLMD
ncbi:MAG: TetR family transcriptional regulator [Marmoricola sp.]|nr:TetR family transcriptional regulator [Marmoricola sp.]